MRHKITQSMFLAIALLTFVCEVLAQHGASGQGPIFPTKPVRVIQPTPPGGASDSIVRALAQKLSEKWRWPVVVENRAGAHGIIGTEIAAKANKDGYTLLFGSIGSLAINAGLYKKLPYDTLNDLQPITQVSGQPHVVLVSSSLPVNSLPELVRLASSKPGELHFASGGSGSGTHLGPAMFFKAAKVEVVHVPYKGGGAALVGLAGNEAQIMFTPLVTSAPLLMQGRIKALAVTGEKRLLALKDIPTLAELGYPHASYTAWFGMLAPARISKTILDKLYFDIVSVVNMPGMADWLAKSGSSGVVSKSPEDFRLFIKSEIVRWGEIIRFTGARVD